MLHVAVELPALDLCQGVADVAVGREPAADRGFEDGQLVPPGLRGSWVDRHEAAPSEGGNGIDQRQAAIGRFLFRSTCRATRPGVSFCPGSRKPARGLGAFVMRVGRAVIDQVSTVHEAAAILGEIAIDHRFGRLHPDGNVGLDLWRGECTRGSWVRSSGVINDLLDHDIAAADQGPDLTSLDTLARFL